MKRLLSSDEPIATTVRLPRSLHKALGEHLGRGASMSAWVVGAIEAQLAAEKGARPAAPHVQVPAEPAPAPRPAGMRAAARGRDNDVTPRPKASGQ